MNLVLFSLVKKNPVTNFILVNFASHFSYGPLKQVYMTINNGSRIVNRHFFNVFTHTKILEISKYKKVNYV